MTTIFDNDIANSIVADKHAEAARERRAHALEAAQRQTAPTQRRPAPTWFTTLAQLWARTALAR
jgi:hypothetical protein